MITICNCSSFARLFLLAICGKELSMYNYGFELKKVREEHKKLRNFCKEQGISDEWVKEIAEFDMESLKKDRSYHIHESLMLEGLMQTLEDAACMNDGSILDSNIIGKITIEIEADFLDSIEDRALYKALKTLTPLQLYLLKLNIIDGLSQSEIARICGTSRETTRDRINAAKRKVRKSYNKY